jgi:hypothetical protein
MSNTLKVAWNRKKLNSVVLSKVKEFSITENTHDHMYSVRGWYNKENAFLFGDDFVTIPEAQKFLDDIHHKM